MNANRPNRPAPSALKPAPRWRLAAAAFAVANCWSPASQAQSAQLERTEVDVHYQNGIGTSDAASAGSVTSKLIENRPTLRPAEVLEFVPGVIITQHSGDGKANQYFLRGFNLDHGTDFLTTIDGMPVNMPSHAHGQGYADMNYLIPELVDRMDYRKGPYFAEDGDFSSAGSARIKLMDTLPRGLAQATVGSNNFQRALVTSSTGVGDGNLLYAAEYGHNDGPWRSPEKFNKFNGVLRYSLATGVSTTSLTAMAYSAHWNATDQLPLRAVNSGAIDRFGNIDPSDGGRTDRFSLSFNTQHQLDDGDWRASAYAIASSLTLYSNFTYDLENPADLGAPIAGDQFEQTERRRVVGGELSRGFDTTIGGFMVNTRVGTQLRYDHVDPLALYRTVQRVRAQTLQESSVDQSMLSLYAESGVQWTPRLRSVIGLRADRADFDVGSSIAGNSGSQHASIVSPKLAIIMGPWEKTEFFLNVGSGFHSNDARGVTSTVSPKEGTAVTPVTPLVRSRGAEVGMRSELVPHLQSSLSIWGLKLASELVFSGDAGDTEVSRASRRGGIEWSNHYAAPEGLMLDLDLAVSNARYTQPDPAGDHVPGAIERVASFGVTFPERGPWSGQFQMRYFGPRALIEDNSERSGSTTLAYARVAYRVDRDWKLMLDVFNLFDRKVSDVDYFYTSRLPGEPAAGVADRHFHPVEPRSFRVTAAMHF